MLRTRRASPRPEDDGGPQAAGRTARLAVPLLGFCLVVAAFLVVVSETVAASWRVWAGSSTYQYALLVPPIVVLLLWRRRRQLVPAIARSGPSAWGVAVAAVAMLGWSLGYLSHTLLLEQLGAVLFVVGAWLALLGKPATRVAAFPLLFLFFIVPFAEPLIPWLQEVTAAFVVAGLRLTGIPVFSDGVFIYIPSGSFEVAEACAGARFLVATLPIGALLAAEALGRWRNRLIMLAASVAVPIVANGIRAFGIVFLAHTVDYSVAAEVDHIVYGQIFFTLVTALLLVAGYLLMRTEPVGPARGGPSDPVGWRRPAPDAAGRHAASRLAAIGMGLLAITVLAGLVQRSDATAGAAPMLATAPPEIGSPWTLSAHRPRQWQPQFPGATSTLLARYEASGGETVDLFVAHYARETAGREVVQSQNRIEGQGWKIHDQGRHAAASPAPANTLRLGQGRQRRLVWYWYWTNCRFVTTGLGLKLHGLLGKLFHGQAATAVVAISAPYGSSADYRAAAAETEALLAGFASAGGARLLPRAFARSCE